MKRRRKNKVKSVTMYLHSYLIRYRKWRQISSNLNISLWKGRAHVERKPAMKRDPLDYGYPTTDTAALSAKAAEVTKRLTERYGEVPFSPKDPMSMLVEILLSHR